MFPDLLKIQHITHKGINSARSPESRIGCRRVGLMFDRGGDYLADGSIRFRISS